jgi:hypothetical protein
LGRLGCCRGCSWEGEARGQGQIFLLGKSRLGGGNRSRCGSQPGLTSAPRPHTIPPCSAGLSSLLGSPAGRVWSAPRSAREGSEPLPASLHLVLLRPQPLPLLQGLGLPVVLLHLPHGRLLLDREASVVEVGVAWRLSLLVDRSQKRLKSILLGGLLPSGWLLEAHTNNLLVGGTEAAGLGHCANCRGALERRSFPVILFLLLSAFEHKVLNLAVVV